MKNHQYPRLVQTSVTNFLYCGDDYLFVKRNPNKKIDPGRLNGVGGRLEPEEDYLHAAIRETEEETGYKVKPEDIRFCGMVKLEGGYEEDWVMAFFKIKVRDKNIPKGYINEEGEFLWLDKDKALDTDHELVDDLYYSFKDVVEGKNIFFITAKVNDKHKIYEVSVGKLDS